MNQGECSHSKWLRTRRQTRKHKKDLRSSLGPQKKGSKEVLFIFSLYVILSLLSRKKKFQLILFSYISKFYFYLITWDSLVYNTVSIDCIFKIPNCLPSELWKLIHPILSFIQILYHFLAWEQPCEVGRQILLQAFYQQKDSD